MKNSNCELKISHISFKNSVSYILKDIDLSIEPGARLSLLGPSGCGKTTLLRIIAGLETPDSGDIFFRGLNMASIPPHRRNFAMMFQEFALFPHRNVFKNIAFGLEMKGVPTRDIGKRVHEMLELVNLEGYDKRDTDELSGGERQRVALARTLAPYPDLLLLDEPLGALDRLLRERLLGDLCHILDKTSVTTVMVTHDHQEAFAVSDNVCVMDQGRVAQVAPPRMLYTFPADPGVADFLGFRNVFDGERVGEGAFLIPDLSAATAPFIVHIDGLDHYFGQQRRGEPVCSPFTRADTQVCPYKMATLAEKMIKPYIDDNCPGCYQCSNTHFDDSGLGSDQCNNERRPKILIMPDAVVLVSRCDHLKGPGNSFAGSLVGSIFQGASWKISIMVEGGGTLFFNVPGDMVLPHVNSSIFFRLKPSGIKIV
ncbi:MAG: ABC transporter ATP-binding protein [Desulfamplus sp.]|nr:ABC transporter ATP-binding protein [Desulfamplus sp.]